MPSSDTQKLATIALDLQIRICTFLHPSDILALRKTCKALQLATTQRIVWIDALHRVCLDNDLFLASFPIPDMTDVALERAAMGPCRWIRLCAAFAREHCNNSSSDESLLPVTRRSISYERTPSSKPSLFLVPGGRYLVRCYHGEVDVWDLGYTSNSDCKLLASVAPKVGAYCCKVSATSDGMGLVIVTHNSEATYPYPSTWRVYEIYPQSEKPYLTKIAQVDGGVNHYPVHYLLPDRVVWQHPYSDRIVFRVWDYRLNQSTCFSADVAVNRFNKIEVIATKTLLIVLSKSKEVLIWEIPPLSPELLDFSDDNPAHKPPLFRIPFPGDFMLKDELIDWQRTSSWYFGSSQPLYFEALCRDSKLHGFELVIKPDLSDASLHVINTSQHPSYDFDRMILGKYRVCEDTLFSCWYSNPMNSGGRCTVSMSSRSPTAIFPGSSAIFQVSLRRINHVKNCSSSCPASGRFVYAGRSYVNEVVVVDFFSDT